MNFPPFTSPATVIWLMGWALRDSNPHRASGLRYNAPFAYSGPASQTRLVPLAAWPVVQYQDWCSKFTDGRPQ